MQDRAAQIDVYSRGNWFPMQRAITQETDAQLTARLQAYKSGRSPRRLLIGGEVLAQIGKIVAKAAK